MHAPTKNHSSAVKRIVRYLHDTIEHGMLICRFSGSTLQAFTDVLWKGRLPLALLVYTLVRPSVISGRSSWILFLLMTTSVFEKHKLIGPNFISWYKQLRIVLSVENKLNYLEHPIPAAVPAHAGQQVPPEALAAHDA
ncbi:hypothetical protein Tco_0606237 [Tanacetum coccineum]